MSAPKDILELVERFDRNIEAYRSGRYNETQIRIEFIDPLFDALGWDVHNKQGYAEAYKDVIHEDAIRVGGATKAPDYAFRIGGARKFFIEAKKPSVNLKDDISPAFQLRRYAWSAKLPLSILTDFEEFAVYDCRTKPVKTDKASTGRVLYLPYTEYAERWEEIAAIFSRQAVLEGAFDKYAQSSQRKRGTADVDAAFLKEIETWREMLARNIALRNPDLAQRELNFGVQRTIDRIIFLRICEDRGIESYGRLMALQNGCDVYARLCQVFHQADARYNSGLFHFRPEKGRPGTPDALTPNLLIDDQPLKAILKSLYYPDSPYEFSVLPADILGQVYEQFLGKVIRLTPAHRAVVEEKPEVKKAGGVYYTPTYIVDYIVEQTVGKLVEGKKPGPRGSVRKLKFLDPACGSGSFLLGAYQYLLDWHLEQYVADGPQKWAKGRTPRVYQTPTPSRGGGGWRLTTAERRRILLNNIYGVDIDPQAVETTKLSLLLKVLEGENEQTQGQQLRLFQERALPDLADNIKCGNSLIGPDFYEGRQMGLFDAEEMYRINVFDWEAEFPSVFRDRSPRSSKTSEISGDEGGFDAVIGNPPWLMAGYYVKDSLDYLRRKFKSAKGKFDLYYLFIERGCRFVSNKGLFGMIVPNKFFHTKAASNLRNFLSKPKWIRGIVDFGHEKIFSRATNYSCILFLQKQSGPNPRYMKAKSGLAIVKEFDFPWSVLSSDTWHFEEQSTRNLFEKLERIGDPLERITKRFGTGVQSGADRLLTVDYATAKAQCLETVLLRPVLRGRDVRRYMVSNDPKLLIFPYKVHEDEFLILSEKELREHTNVCNLLAENKKRLAQRVWFGKGAEELSGKWYGMMYLDSYGSFAAPHLLTPSLSNRSNFALGTGNLFATGTAGVTSIIPKEDIWENILYLLGVLNSNLLSFYAISHSPVFSGGYYKFSAPYLRKLPIRTINFSDPADVARHDRMVALVEQMLALHKRLAAAKVPHEQTALQRQIEATDQQIDALVYELYGLTEEEIGVVGSLSH